MLSFSTIIKDSSVPRIIFSGEVQTISQFQDRLQAHGLGDSPIFLAGIPGHSLEDFDYVLNSTFQTVDGKTLKCYTRMMIGINRFAFALDDQVIISNLEGKSVANKWFKEYLKDLVVPGSKVIIPRRHIYSVIITNKETQKRHQSLMSRFSEQEVKDWYNENYGDRDNYCLSYLKEMF